MAIKFVDIFYLLNLLVFLSLLFVITSQVRLQCHQDSLCRHHLQLAIAHRFPWMRYYTDTADSQWKMIRSSFGLLLFVLVSSRLSMAFLHNSLPNQRNIQTRLYHIISIGFIMIFVLHGYHSLIILAFIAAPVVLSIHSPVLAWGIAIMMLIFKESHRLIRYRGYHYLWPLFHRYGGMYPWHFPVNLLSLRMVSAIIDQNDACKENKENQKQTKTSYQDMLFYLAYMLFPPLYISGPIISFIDF